MKIVRNGKGKENARESAAQDFPERYRVEPPQFPKADLSGAVGRRLLKLISNQAERGLQWVNEEKKRNGMTEENFEIPKGRPGNHPLHIQYNAATNAFLFAVLARLGESDRMMGGTARETLERTAAALIRAVIQTHSISGSGKERPDLWNKCFSLRVDYIFGMGTWLLWDQLDAETRLLTVRVLEHDADEYNETPAPAQLYDDTQAESNAWTSGGLALACCMLKSHPHRRIWGEKAREFMISAYATERDVASTKIVDGKPLDKWLKAPNAFPDYTVENHHIIHPVYIATVSEMVRSAICYRLADEPLPEAVAFNADKVMDVLILLNLPDGNHLYPQGTDYISRRMDSFFQVCNVVPLKPTPLREACFLRVLGGIERMAEERPQLPMTGSLGMDNRLLDLGTRWGLTENYLMRYLFGSGDKTLPENQIEAKLTGVHINELGKFVIHRTAKTLSSFSWHVSPSSSQVMGITLPLDKDVLCCPIPAGSYIGELREAGNDKKDPLKVLSHKAQACDDGFSVMVELERCSGKVRQHSAFVSLPNGWSVYLEERIAIKNVAIERRESGNIIIYDDLRWPFQKKARAFTGEQGKISMAASSAHRGNWVNVDNRMGYVAQGLDSLQLSKASTEYNWWGQTEYDTCRLAFKHVASTNSPETFEKGDRISAFALISSPNQTSEETSALVEHIRKAGWQLNKGGVLALNTGKHLVYMNFNPQIQTMTWNSGKMDLPAGSSGWRLL
ncbi:MAG: hypothetical protein PHW60_11380 [Kiritimatiellae bacterium]|nr:hypothetical protein [Kiritimatiellia bacterium]